MPKPVTASPTDPAEGPLLPACLIVRSRQLEHSTQPMWVLSNPWLNAPPARLAGAPSRTSRGLPTPYGLSGSSPHHPSHYLLAQTLTSHRLGTDCPLAPLPSCQSILRTTLIFQNCIFASAALCSKHLNSCQLSKSQVQNPSTGTQGPTCFGPMNFTKPLLQFPDVTHLF